MRILALSSGHGGASAAILQDGVVLGSARIDAEHGLAALLPAMVAGLVDTVSQMVSHDRVQETGLPERVAAIIGPGTFTGLRAGLSVAHGIALGYGIPIDGVTVGEAMAEAAGPGLDGRLLWTAVVARRGRVFIDRAGIVTGHATDLSMGHGADPVPHAAGRIAVCGNAANIVAAILAARGTDVLLTGLRNPAPRHVAGVSLRRAGAGIAPHPALPLYVDAPEAKAPLRPRGAPRSAGRP